MSKDESVQINKRFIAEVSAALVGRTIVGISTAPVDDVDSEDYIELELSDGTFYRIGVDYDCVDLLAYGVVK